MVAMSSVLEKRDGWQMILDCVTHQQGDALTEAEWEALLASDKYTRYGPGEQYEGHTDSLARAQEEPGLFTAEPLRDEHTERRIWERGDMNNQETPPAPEWGDFYC